MCKLQQAYPPIVHVGVRVEDRKPAVVHMLNICSICLCTAPPRCEQVLPSSLDQRCIITGVTLKSRCGLSCHNNVNDQNEHSLFTEW